MSSVARKKQSEKITNPVSRASYVVNIASRHRLSRNPAPVDDPNPAVPQNFCAFSVIPRYCLANSRSRFFLNPEIPLIFLANPAIPQ